MPMRSLASAARRSAEAMSGRRSSSCDGRPAGMTGGVGAGAEASGSGERGGRLADEDGDGVLVLGALDGDVGGLDACGFELGLRLRRRRT